MIFTLGLDWKSAPLKLREQLAVEEQAVPALLRDIRRLPGVFGCVLLQTCNRFELYWDAAESSDPAELRATLEKLLAGSGEPCPLDYLAGKEACRHLLEVACGLHSQILGEEQILTQVRAAAETAREEKVMSSPLETLFRLAVTDGKESRTKVKLQAVPLSSAGRVVELAAQTLGELSGKRALVIGNGEMGRLAARLLVEAECSVTVTLRSYRHGQTIIPRGCGTVAYEQRLAAMEGSDILVSATRSPHYTVTRSMLDRLSAPPRLAVDMALPRDMEPECRHKPGLTFFDMDDLQAGQELEDSPQLHQIRQIIEKHLVDFEQWSAYRERRTLQEQPPRFPLFVSLAERPCLVVGCGPVGLRRVGVLQEFGARVTVIAPHCHRIPEGARLLRRCFEPGDTKGMVLVVAATDNREVNRQIALECGGSNIPVSVADCPGESSFYFPAICQSQNLVAGLVSKDSNHRLVAQSAAALRQWMKELN